MLNKKSIKVLSIVLLAVILLMTIAGSVCMAAEAGVPSPSAPSADDVKALNTTVETVLGFIQWGGIIAAVIVAMFLGIKYITSSPDGKAEIKKTLAIYIGGIVLLLSASTIVTIIKNSLTGSGNTASNTTTGE